MVTERSPAEVKSISVPTVEQGTSMAPKRKRKESDADDAPPPQPSKGVWSKFRSALNANGFPLVLIQRYWAMYNSSGCDWTKLGDCGGPNSYVIFCDMYEEVFQEIRDNFFTYGVKCSVCSPGFTYMASSVPFVDWTHSDEISLDEASVDDDGFACLYNIDDSSRALTCIHGHTISSFAFLPGFGKFLRKLEREHHFTHRGRKFTHFYPPWSPETSRPVIEAFFREDIQELLERSTTISDSKKVKVN